MYRFGENIARDYDEALKWYRKAASQGDMESAAELGDMYYEGDEIPQNYKLAEKWYLQAAEQGDKDAKKSLDKIHRRLQRH